jgi:hypothetical protein
MDVYNKLTEKRPPISSTFDKSHISHFLFYVVIGIIYPNQYLLAFMLSIVWELFEILIVTNDTLYNLTSKYWIIPEVYWNETLANKGIDIICNMTGYALGSMINKNYKIKIIKS